MKNKLKQLKIRSVIHGSCTISLMRFSHNWTLPTQHFWSKLKVFYKFGYSVSPKRPIPNCQPDVRQVQSLLPAQKSGNRGTGVEQKNNHLIGLVGPENWASSTSTCANDIPFFRAHAWQAAATLLYLKHKQCVTGIRKEGSTGRGDNRSKPVKGDGLVVRYKVKFETVAEIEMRLKEIGVCYTTLS